VKRRTSLRWLERGLLAVGVVLLIGWAKREADSRAYQRNGSLQLDAALRGARWVPGATSTPAQGLRARPVGPAGEQAVLTKRAPASPGRRSSRTTPAATLSREVIGRVEIPRLGLSAIVAEGVDPKTLGRAVGHISSTARPGAAGNCALAGHRDTFLQGLGRLRANDVVRVVTLAGTSTYRVQWVAVVPPHRTDVLDPTATPSLTLVTCYPFRAVGPAPDRFVVRATLAEPTAANIR
jgi:sortase A